MASPQLAMEKIPVMKRPTPVFLALIIGVAGIVIYGLSLRWTVLTIAVSPSSIAGLLAPLVLASAVVERGVEILISPWRDTGAAKLQKTLAAIQARPADPTTEQRNAQDLKAAMDALDEYRGQTQQFAFAISLILALFVSISGVRALGPFVDSAAFAKVSQEQQAFFLCVDTALTALLLSGGADGLHSVLNAVTSFFNASATKSSGQ